MKIKKLIYVLVGTLVGGFFLLRHGAWEWKRRDGDSNRQQVFLWLKCMLMKRESTCSQAIYLVKEGAPRTITLNVPIHTEKVYMEYNTVSGAVKKTAFTLSPATRSETYPTGDFAYETSRIAAVKLLRFRKMR